MELGEFIAHRRKELRLTQEEVVERMRSYGVDRASPTLGNWEAGRQAIPLEVLPALAQALELSSPVKLYDLAGVLANLPGGEIIKLFDGMSDSEIRRWARMIQAFLQESK